MVKAAYAALPLSFQVKPLTE